MTKWKSTFSTALCRLDSRECHLGHDLDASECHFGHDLVSRECHHGEAAQQHPTMPTATTAKAGVAVEHHEIHPHPPLDLATCSLFTAYGVHPDLSAWFNRTCASRLHLSTNHDLGLGDDDGDDPGPNCAICQDTTAGCFLYLTLPCCHQVVGDECLLSWFLGGDITHRRARAAKKPARTTCPCCRADLLPPPAVTPATWGDAQEERALAAIIEESRAWIVDRPPPPRAGSSSRPVKREGKPRRRGIWEALHWARRASVRRSSRSPDVGVME